MNPEIYSGKLRIRACGLLVEKEKLLLVQLQSPVTNKLIWLPPGGGVETGETIYKALKREFQEETGLEVSVEKLVHINEMIEEPFHAIELFFSVKRTGGNLKLGADPEYKTHEQLLKNLQYFSREELQNKKVMPHFLKDNFWELDGDFGLQL